MQLLTNKESKKKWKLAQDRAEALRVKRRLKKEEEETAEKKVDGKSVSITAYSLVVDASGTQVEIKLHADADRHLLAWDVPSQGYTAVRDGYQDLLKPAK